MRCPYNGFKETDCEECAAWNKIPNPGSKAYIDTITVCTIAYHGGTVPTQTMLYVPGPPKEE